MRFTHILRAGATALVLVGAAAADRAVLAQTGAPAGDATGISRPLGIGTMQSLFPQTVMPLPQGGGGIGGFTDRVKTRSTNLPNREGMTLINVGTPYVNAIFGGIPDGAGLAGGIELTTADKLGSQFELYGDALVSIRKYRRFEVGALIGKERDRGEVRFRYTRRVKDNFFGLGPFSDEVPVLDPLSGLVVGGETNFDHEERSFQAGYSHYFDRDKWSVGVYVDYTSSSIYEGDDDADPSIFLLYQPYTAIEVTGPVSEAVFTSQLPGLGAGSKIFSYGVFTEADYRNNDEGLTRGGYGYVRFAGHDGTDSSDLNTFVGPVGFGWNQFTADLRGYVPVFSDKTSVALRFYTDLNHQRGGDVIPFYDLARLGGTSSLRGFDTFRFYGANAVLFQGEFRRTVYNWSDDVTKGVDINIFADAGQVWDLGYEPKVFQPSIPSFERADDFKFDNYEVDAGFGVTVRVAKAFALRLDYAHSNETNKVKLLFSRGF